jgi:hypothetical protein
MKNIVIIFRGYISGGFLDLVSESESCWAFACACKGDTIFEKGISWQMSFWANVFLGKCLLGECLSCQMSFWAIVFLGKCLSGQISSGEMSFWAIVFFGKYL